MPVTAGAIGSVAGPILGGIVGNIASSGDRDAAKQAQEAALKQWLAVHVPNVADQQIQLDHYRQTGQLTPQLQQTFQQGQTELNNVAIDPTSRAAEMNALAKMQGLANAGGMDAQAKATYQQGLDQANAAAKAQRDAVLQNAAARGVGGSGAELTAQLMAGQSAANRANQAGLQSASDAEQRALQAMASSATLGSNINAQDYGQAAAKANAADAINRFNTANSQQVAGANAGTSNAAQAANLAAQQRTSDMNTDVQHTQEIHNKGLPEQNFNDQMRLAGGTSGAYDTAAAGDTQRAGDTAKMWSGVGNAIGTAGAAVAQKKADPSKTPYSTEVA